MHVSVCEQTRMSQPHVLRIQTKVYCLHCIKPRLYACIFMYYQCFDQFFVPLEIVSLFRLVLMLVAGASVTAIQFFKFALRRHFRGTLKAFKIGYLKSF